ncbi:Crp/Fnr family transcriptional regulator [Aurantiacibacter aquimixticola]|uniref:Crp/Fnr family transcriptional regulator n=1 Tax=Aurantiacibacter aquimixticola TaxID=1958945 RepID=A0A419RQF5_9SPHN|nr:Crp/Fnr family transcriptional regulator [Aurantiacibacter aquimixticola]RJY08011.1 Crp/Fnr family transcriptional regulator [Aurantiacibacter aquimixticola]
MSLSCSTCPVRDSAACAVLSEEERAELAHAGTARQLGRGETLFRAGDRDAACATLISGALKVTSFDAEGKERILALIHPAGFVGELFAPFPSHDVVALTDCRLCVFARTSMEAALDKHPALSRALLRRAQDDLHAARDLLALGSGCSADAQVGALVLAMARAASDSPCHPAARFDLPLTRCEMASMLGLTIETVSRSLSRLEKDGAIQRKGTRGIELLDPTRLEE